MTATATAPVQRDPTVRRYGAVAIAFHWTIAILILANLALGLLADGIEEAWGASPIPLHKSIGLTVLVLSVARLAWRLGHRPPPLPEHVGPGERGAAHGVHWTLYTLMVLMPLTGWIMSSAGKYPLTWFGLFPVPKFPVTKGDAIVDLSANGHGLLGWLLLALAMGHIAAAFRHHYLLRDQVLRRMWPA